MRKSSQDHTLAGTFVRSDAELDAWMVFAAAAHDVPVDRIAAVFAGAATAVGLDEKLVAGIVDRFNDPALAHEVCGATPDPQVQAALWALEDRAGACRAAHRAALVAELAAAVATVADPSHGRRRSVVRAALTQAAHDGTYPVGAVADVVIDVLENRVEPLELNVWSPGERLALTSSLLEDLSRRSRAVAVIIDVLARLDTLEEGTVAAVVTTVTGSSVVRNAVRAASARTGQAAGMPTLTHLATAIGCLDKYGSSNVVFHGGSTSAINVVGDLAKAFLRAGGPLFGDGSLAEAYGHRGEGVPTDRIVDQLFTAAMRCGDPAAVTELVAKVTCGGATVRPLHTLWPRLAPGVDPGALACALPVPPSPEATRELATELVDAAMAGLDASVFLDALETHQPDLARAFLAQLTSVRNRSYDDLPAVWVHASMRAYGLAPWVRLLTGVRDELLDAGAGMGRHRWELIAQMLPTFLGTPDELVAVVFEAAPAAAPTIAVAAAAR